LILNEKVIGKIVDEPAGESGFGDEDEGFHEDELNAEEFGDEKEGEGDAGAGREEDIGFFVIKDFDGQDKVFEEVDEVAAFRKVGIVDGFVFEHVEFGGDGSSDPEALMFLPPGFKAVGFVEMAAGRGDEAEFKRRGFG
jgi:hypothetical protein